MLCDARRQEAEGMRVRCVICGFEAEVNPRIAAIYGHRPHRSMNAPPQIWICDTHFSDDHRSNSDQG
jgi:hypothetical protein